LRKDKHRRTVAFSRSLEEGGGTTLAGSSANYHNNTRRGGSQANEGGEWAG